VSEAKLMGLMAGFVGGMILANVFLFIVMDTNLLTISRWQRWRKLRGGRWRYVSDWGCWVRMAKDAGPPLYADEDWRGKKGPA